MKTWIAVAAVLILLTAALSQVRTAPSRQRPRPSRTPDPPAASPVERPVTVPDGTPPSSIKEEDRLVLELSREERPEAALALLGEMTATDDPGRLVRNAAYIAGFVRDPDVRERAALRLHERLRGPDEEERDNLLQSLLYFSEDARTAWMRPDALRWVARRVSEGRGDRWLRMAGHVLRTEDDLRVFSEGLDRPVASFLERALSGAGRIPIDADARAVWLEWLKRKEFP